MLPIKYYSVFHFLNAIAASDRKIFSSEDEFIWVTGAELNSTRGRLEAISNQFVNGKTKSKESASSLLGLKGDVDSSGYNI